MKCCECQSEIEDRSVCPYCSSRQKKGGTKTEPAKPTRTTCGWSTGLCKMLATVRGGGSTHLCCWHHDWSHVLARATSYAGLDEQKEFQDWVEQHRPGRTYGHNPGQWWAASGVLWDALNGRADCPTRNDAIDLELRRRNNLSWWLSCGKKPPASLFGATIAGEPLPPWPPLWIRELAESVGLKQEEVERL